MPQDRTILWIILGVLMAVLILLLFGGLIAYGIQQGQNWLQYFQGMGVSVLGNMSIPTI